MDGTAVRAEVGLEGEMWGRFRDCSRVCEEDAEVGAVRRQAL